MASENAQDPSASTMERSRPGYKLRQFVSALKGRSRGTLLLVAGIISIAGFLPVILYALVFKGIPTISTLEARRVLGTMGASAILVDVSQPELFTAGHLAVATNWPLEEILALSSKDDVPPQYRDKHLLLICQGGIHSALAARKLVSISLEVSNIHGGIQAWIAAASMPGGEPYANLQASSGEIARPTFLPLSRFEQIATVAASLLVKPIYMLLSVVIVVILWRSRARDLATLRWGIILFLMGETACIFNTVSYFRGGQQSDLFEYLHGAGMAMFLGFLSHAIFDGLDQRLVHYSHPGRRCALLGLCRACKKYNEVPCGLERTLKLTLPLLAVLAIMPLNARLHMESYNTKIFNLHYNFSHPGIHQFFEIRFLPILAIVLFASSLLVLVRKKFNAMPTVKILMASGFGALAYSLLMLSLLTMYRDSMVWFVFWEEATELLLIGTILLVLWVFRRGLLAGSLRDRISILGGTTT